MQIVPTLNFGGNCREAIHMYKRRLMVKSVASLHMEKRMTRVIQIFLPLCLIRKRKSNRHTKS